MRGTSCQHPDGADTASGETVSWIFHGWYARRDGGDGGSAARVGACVGRLRLRVGSTFNIEWPDMGTGCYMSDPNPNHDIQNSPNPNPNL